MHASRKPSLRSFRGSDGALHHGKLRVPVAVHKPDHGPMNAAGRTLTVVELVSEIDFRVARTTPVYVVDGEGFWSVDRIEVDGGGVILYTDNDATYLVHRVNALEEVLRSIADSDQVGSKMTKAQIIAAAEAALG